MKDLDSRLRGNDGCEPHRGNDIRVCHANFATAAPVEPPEIPGVPENPMELPPAPSGRGFTLVELILVLFIVTLTIGLIIPRIGAGWHRMEEREFLQEMVQTLQRAHIRAMSSGEPALFRIRGSERTYGIDDPPRQAIPDNADVYSDRLGRDLFTRDRIIVFYPDGSVSDNDLMIVFDKGRTYRIFIHPIAGTVRLVKVKA